jgi:hypothetical protein
MITTIPDSGDEEDIIMDSTDGEGIPLFNAEGKVRMYVHPDIDFSSLIVAL